MVEALLGLTFYLQSLVRGVIPGFHRRNLRPRLDIMPELPQLGGYRTGFELSVHSSKVLSFAWISHSRHGWGEGGGGKLGRFLDPEGALDRPVPFRESADLICHMMAPTPLFLSSRWQEMQHRRLSAAPSVLYYLLQGMKLQR